MPKESTTPDVVELNLRFVEAWNRRDVEAMVSFFAPDAVWEGIVPGTEQIRGRTAIRGHLEDRLRPYEEYQVQLEELLELGNGVSFSVSLHKGRLVGGSNFVQMRLPVVVLREGDLVVRIKTYTDRDQARAAAERLAEERG